MEEVFRSDNKHSISSSIVLTLIESIQKISLAYTIDEVSKTVRSAARSIAHADGATFVLKEDGFCYYLDEEAISPLWKGMKFPISSCISGIAMLNKEQIAIADIYTDARIPQDIYRSTFVRSLLMTPIRQTNPLGAIGVYWKQTHQPTEEEAITLQALADSTSIAIENIGVLKELETRVKSLEKANYKLQRLAWLVSHDLKEPIRHINLRIDQFKNQHPSLSTEIEHLINSISASSQNAYQLTLDLFNIFEVDSQILVSEDIDLNLLLQKVLRFFSFEIETNKISIKTDNLPHVFAEPTVIIMIFRNIISNAIKYKKPTEPLQLNISSFRQDSQWVISIKDNGIGIAREFHHKIFDLFNRVNSINENKEGSGVGLSLCKKIVEEFGGKIWIDSTPNEGSCFYFSLPRSIVLNESYATFHVA